MQQVVINVILKEIYNYIICFEWHLPIRKKAKGFNPSVKSLFEYRVRGDELDTRSWEPDNGVAKPI